MIRGIALDFVFTLWTLVCCAAFAYAFAGLAKIRPVAWLLRVAAWTGPVGVLGMAGWKTGWMGWQDSLVQGPWALLLGGYTVGTWMACVVLSGRSCGITWRSIAPLSVAGIFAAERLLDLPGTFTAVASTPAWLGSVALVSGLALLVSWRIDDGSERSAEAAGSLAPAICGFVFGILPMIWLAVRLGFVQGLETEPFSTSMLSAPEWSGGVDLYGRPLKDLLLVGVGGTALYAAIAIAVTLIWRRLRTRFLARTSAGPLFIVVCIVAAVWILRAPWSGDVAAAAAVSLLVIAFNECSPRATLPALAVCAVILEVGIHAAGFVHADLLPTLGRAAAYQKVRLAFPPLVWIGVVQFLLALPMLAMMPIAAKEESTEE